MKDKFNSKIIIGIDTSCDDTSVAIIQGTKVLSNVISSQVDLHKEWGGVVPNLAKRAHQERIDLVIKKAFAQANRKLPNELTWTQIDAIAVTKGPGLAIALEVGLKKALELAEKYHKQLVLINHMEGHLLSVLANNSKGKMGFPLERLEFPIFGVLISGGHTQFVVVEGIGDYRIIAETLDDAIGEAYDKVGRMLGLGYPAGPTVTEFAKKGDREKFPLPVPLQKKKKNRPNLSYSGLKTAVYYMVNELKQEQKLDQQAIYDICASFEYAAVKHLTQKLELSLKTNEFKYIFVGGGVSASTKVRKEIRKVAKIFNTEAYFPYSAKLSMDNGAMIAVAGLFHLEDSSEKIVDIDRDPRLRLGGR